MRKYDGKDYKYTNANKSDEKKASKIIKNILGFMPNKDGLVYDLDLYAGGIGVYDKLAIKCIMSDKNIAVFKERKSLFSPEEMLNDEAWADDFIWLIENEEENKKNINECAIEFINENKRDFQDIATSTSTMYFLECSNVNDWEAFWGTEQCLNYLGFSQG